MLSCTECSKKATAYVKELPFPKITCPPKKKTDESENEGKPFAV